MGYKQITSANLGKIKPTPSIKGTISSLRSSFNHPIVSPLGKNIMVTRHMNLDAAAIAKHLIPGHVWAQPNFMSTSASKKWSWGVGNVSISIEVPAEAKGIIMSKVLGVQDDEEEILFNIGTKLAIKSVDVIENTTTTYNKYSKKYLVIAQIVPPESGLWP